jgi:3-phosphoshikimate 1-carboxyvinyltransferase
MVIEQKKVIKGEITVPGDKSISHRAIIASAIAQGTSEIDGILLNEDCLATIECLRKVQVGIEILQQNKLRVYGRGLHGLKPAGNPLNAGNSGTTIRLLLGLLAGQGFNFVITGDDRAHKKPMSRVVKPLRSMGANIIGKEDGNYVPFLINASKLTGVKLELPNSGAQLKSSVLLASLYAEGDTVITERIKSRDHTELMLNNFGANILIQGNTVTCSPVTELFSQSIQIPGDISYAIYFVIAGLLVQDGEIVVKNVGINPTRMAIFETLKEMGANIEITNKRTINNEMVGDICARSSQLKGVTISSDRVARMIDELPALAVAACIASGTTVIEEAPELAQKEINRLKAISLELAKMGAKITESPESVIIEGGKQLKGTIVETSNDDHIAMALAMAGLVAEGETMIRKAQCVDVVFPEFFDILYSL